MAICSCGFYGVCCCGQGIDTMVKTFDAGDLPPHPPVRGNRVDTIIMDDLTPRYTREQLQETLDAISGMIGAREPGAAMRPKWEWNDRTGQWQRYVETLEGWTYNGRNFTKALQ